MTHGVFRISAALLSVVAGLGAAEARTLEQSRTGGWSVSALADDRSGAFTNCEAESETENDARLLVSLDHGAKWSIGLLGKLGVQTGETNTVRYRIDRGRLFSGAATAVSDSQVRMPLTDPDAALRELRAGRQLIVDGGNDRLTFSLKDVTAMLSELRGCAEKWQKQDVALAGQARQPARAPTEAERRLEAITVGVNILSRAQIVGFELQPADSPPRLAGHDVTWKAQNLNGSLRLVGLDGGVVLEKVRAELISTDILACVGRFTAESTSGADGKSASLFTLCQGDKGWSLNYLVIPRPQGGAYVMSLVGTGDKVEPLRAMAESLRGVALQVIPQTQ